MESWSELGDGEQGEMGDGMGLDEALSHLASSLVAGGMDGQG